MSPTMQLALVPVILMIVAALRITRVAAADVTDSSGDLRIRDVPGDVRVSDVSGNVEVAVDSSGDLDSERVKGKFTLGSKGSGDVRESEIGGGVDIRN